MSLHKLAINEAVAMLDRGTGRQSMSDDQLKLWDLERRHQAAHRLLLSSQMSAEEYRQKALVALGTISRLEAELKAHRESMNERGGK